MGNDFYDLIADVYSELQSDMDIEAWVDRLQKYVEEYRTSVGEGRNNTPILVDLGCGNGQIVSAMASKYGYEAIGIDRSYEMLEKAGENTANVLWLNQDITSYELFGAADVFISTMDTVNHLTREGDVDKLFASFVNYMAPGGVFIFDVCTRKHFEKTLGNNVFYEDSDDFTLLWVNSYEDGLSTSDMTLFRTEDGETYERFDGTIAERYYEEGFLTDTARKYGLEKVFSGKDQDEEREFYVFRRFTPYG